MGDDATNNAQMMIKIRKNIFNTFFNTLENRELLFKKVFNIFEYNNKNEDYIYDLKKNKKLFEEFKNSITLGHFNWFEGRIINQNKTTLDNKYFIASSKVIKDITKKPYCHFYQAFIQTISKSEFDLRPTGKEIVKKNCSILLEKYKC